MLMFPETLKAWLRDGRARWRLRTNDLARPRREREALETLYRFAIDTTPAETRPLAGVVFSRNRAMQLHALLTSYARNARGALPPLHVLYSAGSNAHRAAYDELFAAASCGHEFPAIAATPDGATGFREALIRMLEELDSQRLFFLVDDIVFTRPVDYDLLAQVDSYRYVTSLRLGRQHL